MLSPRQNDVDGFFTDQSQQKSFQQKSDDDDDDEWNETRRWVDELHHLNSSFIPEQQYRNIGPMGMSRDSLNGTITGTNIYQTNDNQHEQPLPPTSESVSAERVPSIVIQQQENNPSRSISRRSSSASTTTSKHRTTPIPSPRPPSLHNDEVKF